MDHMLLVLGANIYIIIYIVVHETLGAGARGQRYGDKKSTIATPYYKSEGSLT
jgi:hypothetical protein